MDLRPQAIDSLAGMPGVWHLALGVFDGVHLGHQEVIGRAVAAARREGGRSAVVTFDPHPARVLAPERPPACLLSTLDHKARLVGELGVDACLVIPFDQAVAGLTAEEFIAWLCRLCPGLRRLVVGVDWRFGRGRRGDVALLAALGEAAGFVVEAVEPVVQNGERISSTRIRAALAAGKMQAAAAMLGRDYTVLGTVVKGRQLGRTLGFPTANLLAADEQLPPDGVWAVRVRAGTRWLHGVANLGRRPTLGEADAPRMLEIHLFDFDGDLYGATLEVGFVRFLRGEQKFESLEQLQQAIQADVAAARG